jgi:hypothetical protein
MGGTSLKNLPHWGRWQREALTEGGANTNAAVAAARFRAQFGLPPSDPPSAAHLPQRGRL